MTPRLPAAFALAGALAAMPALGAQSPAAPPLPVAEPNDNARPGGVLRDGVLRLRLDAVTAVWTPEGPAGPTRTVQLFAEPGRPPQVPGPLVRVPEGTDIHLTLANRLGVPLKLHGMMTRPGDPAQAVEIPAGGVQDLRFRAGEPGTYLYWATTTPSATINLRRTIDTQLSGGFIIDAAGDVDAARDRVFVITEWLDQSTTPGKLSATINGASWPRTERLTLPFGEPVHWRVINASFAAHPMHLHGTFYTVESRGDTGRDRLLDAGGRRMVTTELLEPGSTMRMRWVPDRVGNWLFHCHLLVHISGDMRLGDMSPDERKAAADHQEHDIERAMAGLVLGITVPPGDETAAPDLEPHVRRQLTLRMRELRPGYATAPTLGFEIFDAQGAAMPTFAPRLPASPGRVGQVNPSPTLVLTRGEPVTITLESQLSKETQIHWHGIELESYNDGVPGWSGHLRQITPAIAPGGRYEVRFTPPRAGTFIYHTHAHDSHQLSAGLYGALVVVEPGEPFDPAVERVVVIGSAGPDSQSLEVNRTTTPLPIDLKAGVTYRFRLINISTNYTAIVSLRGDVPLQWRPISKDGADLPPSQMAPRPATQLISVGETYDFEFMPPAPGELRLEVRKRVVDPILTSIIVRVAAID